MALALHGPAETARWLKERGFDHVDGEWYQRENVRVVVNRTGRVSVFVHTERPYTIKLDEDAPRAQLAAVLSATGLTIASA